MAQRSEDKTEEIGEIPEKVAVDLRLSAWVHRDWFLGLILILAVFLAYQPVWYAGFIWDDDLLVTGNPCMIGLRGLEAIWTTSAADICPLTLTTFWVEHALWGLAPLPYHLVNVLMHGACAIVLWRVLRSLQIPGAWLGAALWALHPVQVESVAWITEMKNTQSGLFFLPAILFFARWLKPRQRGNRNGIGWNYALTLLFAALAMASKSSTVILPVVLCLCAWWMEGRWQWRNLARVAPIFLMSIAASAVSIWTQKPQLATGNDPQGLWTWPERVVGAGRAVWFYLGKLVWPHPLITVYPRWQIDAGQWGSYLPLLAVIVVLSILWLNRESWCRPWFFAFAYFLAALFPVLGLVNMSFFRYSFVADHLQYLASMGPLALAAAGMVRLADFVIPEWPWLQSSLCSGLLLILGLVSWQRSWVYESQETLWTDTLAKNPDCWLGHNNIGEVLFQKGQVDEAIAQFQKALQIDPNNAALHINFGRALSEKGQVDEAIAQFQRAVEIEPNFTEAHNDLGVTLAKRGRGDEAIAEYQKTLEIDPDFAKAHYNLGIAFFQKGSLDEAMAQFQKALEIDSDYAEARNNLGIALFQKRQVDEAIIQFQEALKINPKYAEAHRNLGMALSQKGKMDEAIVHYQRALEINPNYGDAHLSLGIALFGKGEVNEAIAQFKEAVQLEPDNRNAQMNLAKAQAMAGQKAGEGK